MRNQRREANFSPIKSYKHNKTENGANMKRISVIILLAIALTTIFSACSSTESTDTIARWQDDETQTFVISKANLTEAAQTYTVDGTSEEFVKYPLGRYEYTSTVPDELEPSEIGGTYVTVLDLNDTATEALYSTDKHLYLKYAKTDLAELNIDITSDEWSSFVLYDCETQNQSATVWDDETLSDVVANNPLTPEADYVILYSRQTTSVKFENQKSQHPLESSTKWDSVYFGKTAQTATHCDITVTYDWDEKKLAVAENGATTYETSFSASTMIDSNQLLLYTRSLEKTSGKFEDSPSVSVFSAVDKQQYTVSFNYFVYTYYTLATTADGDVPVALNLVGASVSSMPLFVQTNLPDTVDADSYSLSGSASYHKYTTTSFRSGLYYYELQTYSDEILNSIKATTDSTDESEDSTEENIGTNE